ncbi:MAG: response regulator [Candidatus Portnoybacteria bacterium CG10_big_fil_rev_8_21_14_0_10_36_7]|uniref:Response regulator n=1 Tax=Candidatus Portnoybacteria bacterium CG10_big_fil_rev_8_21_14_0_10_36_7 TaxID=1974812 RepID=A0A2M8KDN7_9BACT|nr:MAG: response regulator [Candidatus Portnoybacteria bacterium CG10_big_fil_rev_8_21_14_0_10_36_7]
MSTILIVEDDPFLSKMYVEKLEAAGFNIEAAMDGEQALNTLNDKSVDLVLLDIVLPKKDGFEILRDIKANPKLNNAKVVMLSNLGQEEDIKKGADLGADGYLVKSHFTPSEVLAKIKTILNKNKI